MNKPIFRMSQAGYCPKRLSAMLLGRAPSAPPVWLSRAAAEGHWHEQRLKDELRSLDCEVQDGGECPTCKARGLPGRMGIHVEMAQPNFVMLGHLDGKIKLSARVLRDKGLFEVYYIGLKETELDIELSKYPLEIKSMSFLEFQRWSNEGFEGFPEYACQHTSYLRATGSDIYIYAIKDRSGGTRRLYIIEGESTSMPAILEKLDTVVQYVSSGQLAPAEFDPDRLQCRRCDFRTALCGPPKVEVDDLAIIEAAANYLEGRAIEKDGKEQAEAAKPILVEFARARKLSRWDVGALICYYSRFPRETVSVKRLEELMPREQFESAINVSQIDRVRVVNPEEEDSGSSQSS